MRGEIVSSRLVIGIRLISIILKRSCFCRSISSLLTSIETNSEILNGEIR